MKHVESTCWSIIEGAAKGDAADRREFARLYIPVVTNTVASRWRLPADHEEVVNAVQEVFLECFKPSGPLGRADRSRSGGFRAFLWGITRTVVLDIQRKRARHLSREPGGELQFEQIPDSGERLSEVFDREWGVMMLREAGNRLVARAEEQGDAARDRVAVLRYRFRDELPPREIAERLGIRRDQVYEALRTAKKEFESALMEVLSFSDPNATAEQLRQRCIELVMLTS